MSVQKHPNIRTNWNNPGVMAALESGPFQAVRPSRVGRLGLTTGRVNTHSPRGHNLALTSL